MKKKILCFLCILIFMITSILTGCEQSVTINIDDSSTISISDERQISEQYSDQIPEQVSDIDEERNDDRAAQVEVEEQGEYTTKDEVAAYIHQYDHLPSNYITKKQAKNLGWVNTEGNLGEVAPGKSIGGDYFGNYEGLLPEDDQRTYYECDIDSTGSYRGPKRIIFSNDGLIYYTEDHYESFTLLYDKE